MPSLILKGPEPKRCISFVAGQSIRAILDTTDVRVRSGCRGQGACGMCRVRIETGPLGVPTEAERLYLDQSELAQGIRLACQVVPRQDLEIEILAAARISGWRSLPAERGPRLREFPLAIPEGFPVESGNPCGIAVDLGTTHICLSLYRLRDGQWLTGRTGLNPQWHQGADVMSRLVAAAESCEQARALRRQVLEAIGEGLRDIAIREGIDPGRVVRLKLVGNTAMLALLSGRNHRILLQPEHWMKRIDCLPDHPEEWARLWGLDPLASIEVVPPLAGFVGSDLLAGVVATGLAEREAGSLLIDFGTNSELALWDGKLLRITAAAGGPAFEGSGIRCGMPAEPGAIYQLEDQNGSFEFTTIAGDQPRGLCGSGLVDLIAELLRTNRLTEFGRFTKAVSGGAFVLTDAPREIRLTKRDVDRFQRAKAAIGVGIHVLLDAAGMAPEDLSRIFVGGAFGHFLKIENARRIGLLPGLPSERIELCGNTALAGCEQLLLSAAAVRDATRLRERTQMINLTEQDDFGDLFLNHLYLRPM